MAATYDLNDESVVVIIGSGAGGGTLSRQLSINGVKVVCLEAGPRLTLGDIVNDETSPNDFTLYQTSTSKEGLHKHMKEHFYRWKPFMNTGAVLAYKHTYI